MTTYAATYIDASPLFVSKSLIIKSATYIDDVATSASKVITTKSATLVGGGGITSVVTETYYVLNRGRNTGAGDAYVYWTSPEAPDPTGVHYPAGKPPFGQITDIIGVTIVKVGT